MFKFITYLVFIVLAVSSATCAEFKLAAIIQDHMILQQGVVNTIWGTAKANQEISVTYASQKTSVITNANGEWKVLLTPMKASSKGCELLVVGEGTIVVKDVLVGEVWLASGQSNMVSGIKQVPGLQKNIFSEQKDNKRVRAFINDKWYMLSEQALHTSAVAFFFALKLEKKLDVPVGYVVVAQLGSKIEPFVPSIEAKAANLGNKSSNIFNKRILPILNYSFKGVIWYQGESNRGSKNYFECLQALHRGWSRAFDMARMPFYMVQIAPYNKSVQKTSLISDSVWAAQYRAANEIPGMGLIALHDTGINVKKIHPSSKQPVGERLAALALKNQYAKNVVTTGPVFSKATYEGNKVILSFEHIDQGLVTKDGKAPSYFELSVDGENFVEARASIRGDQVEVESEFIKKAKFVRMGWFDIAIPNLQDKNGWPVFAFPKQEIR